MVLGGAGGGGDGARVRVGCAARLAAGGARGVRRDGGDPGWIQPCDRRSVFTLLLMALVGTIQATDLLDRSVRAVERRATSARGS